MVHIEHENNIGKVTNLKRLYIQIIHKADVFILHSRLPIYLYEDEPNSFYLQRIFMEKDQEVLIIIIMGITRKP